MRFFLGQLGLSADTWSSCTVSQQKIPTCNLTIVSTDLQLGSSPSAGPQGFIDLSSGPLRFWFIWENKRQCSALRKRQHIASSPSTPSPAHRHVWRKDFHRQQLLQAQGSLKSSLLVHGSRGRGIKMPLLSQNTPAASLPAVVTFQDAILNHHSPFQFPLEFLQFFSTTQSTSTSPLTLQRNR